jgi:hypothetical protein
MNFYQSSPFRRSGGFRWKTNLMTLVTTSHTKSYLITLCNLLRRFEKLRRVADANGQMNFHQSSPFWGSGGSAVIRVICGEYLAKRIKKSRYLPDCVRSGSILQDLKIFLPARPAVVHGLSTFTRHISVPTRRSTFHSIFLIFHSLFLWGVCAKNVAPLGLQRFRPSGATKIPPLRGLRKKSVVIRLIRVSRVSIFMIHPPRKKGI